jgi:disulfide bond formation protein DsbB
MRFANIRLFALLLPLALLAGAYGSQYFGGLYPCEMCWWQRYPHFAAVPIAALAVLISNTAMQRVLVALAAFAILTSGVIGGFHAGVEYGWWKGPATCTGPVSTGGDLLKSIMETPLVMCDVPQWTLFGISLAGFNFLLSCCGAIAILAGLWRNPKN